jgi:hypothetical protein
MNVGTSAGQLFQEVPKAMFRGVGDGGSACVATGFQMWTADENAATQETYSIVFRGPLSTGGPDMSAAGLIGQIGPFLTPLATGRAGWQITATFGTPLTLPCEDSFYLGIDVQAAPWSSDGQSLYVAYYYPPATRFIGDNPRGNAPNHAWQAVNGVATISASQLTVRVGALVTTPVLNIGSIDPLNAKQVGTCYGAGGMYPDVSSGPRDDGLEARVRDAARAGGRALLLLSSGYWFVPGGLTYPGFTGHLWLDVTSMVSLGNGTLGPGDTVIPIVPANVLPASLMGASAYVQAVTVDATLANGRFSNVAVVSF